ncbi:hypothetical protein ACWCYY_40685 [Kitasatospora sp. NPDC001664]
MMDDGGVKRADFLATMLFGAVYGVALVLVVMGFAAEPGGCGGRFRGGCAGGMYWRLGAGFGLIAVVAPLLHRVAPNVPFERGVGRAAAVAALASGAVVGAAAVVTVSHLVG